MQTIKPISANNQVLFDQISQETEDLYLPQYLGDGFAYDVQENVGNYDDLLEGDTFTNCNDETVKFKGVYYWLAYFIYAEYSWQTKIKDTMTGLVLKNREEATSVSQGLQSQIKNQARKQGEYQVELMKDYLNENSDTYPLWHCGTKGRAYTPKITNVKRTNS
jgi:hypothetical protein